MAENMEGQLLILSGERGAGKTTLIQHLVDNFRKAGWRVRGLFSPAVFENGVKTAIAVEDLDSGERRRLAVHDPKPKIVADSTPPLHWSFAPDVLNWGNDVLSAAVPCDLLVIDELGPLEILKGQGWQAGIDALDSRAYRLAILVMRPALLSHGLEKWTWARVVSVPEVSEVSALAEQIVQGYLYEDGN